MGNEYRGLSSHSAESFGDSRDYWWHDDYFTFVSRHWQLERVKAVLDVGSGVGHWGRRLATVLPAEARVSGLDREPLWVDKATERAERAGLGHRFDYRVGEAHALPFEDATFDLVTCQTVLMHVGDPARVVAEMTRVVRPGGLVLVAEPSNVYGPVLLGALVAGEPVDMTTRLVGFQLTCQHGKKNLGEGDAAVGEHVPGMFAAAGLEGIEVRQNDRAYVFMPPYALPEQRAWREEFLDHVERGRWLWDRDETLRFFLAGGGASEDFDTLWDDALAMRQREADGIRAERVSYAAGGMFYLVWGFRPAESGA